MKLRAVLWLALAPAPLALLQCVGDAPVAPGVDAATDSRPPADAAADTGSPDTGPADAGADVACPAVPPSLFSPKPDAGPFCKGAQAGDHCNFGDHCCFNLATTARSCASSCEAGVADIACFSAAECTSGLSCCGNGTVKTKTCVYPVISAFTSSVCAATCSNAEFVECAGSAECSGKVCTPALVLNPEGTALTTIQVGECQ